MKLVTFQPPGGGSPVAGEIREGRAIAFAEGETVLDRLASGDRTRAPGDGWPLVDVQLLAPIPRPRAIFGIGLNYASHAAEQGVAPPE